MTSETASQNDRDAKELTILDLFDGWISAKPSADNLRAYCAEVDPFSIEAVRRSVKQFRGGLVPDHNMDFPPSAAQFTKNVRDWQKALDLRAGDGVTLHNGLLDCDWGNGRVDLRGLTAEDQNIVIAGKGFVNGRNLAYLALPEIRQVISQGDLAAIEGGKQFAIPSMRRMT